MQYFSSISNQYINQKSLSINNVQKKQSSFFKPIIQPKLTISQPNPNPLISKTYTELLFKGLDVIQDTIKNLDDIIHKSKTFAFLTWGGSMYLITQHLNIKTDQDKGYLLLLTAVIPLLFWAMDYKWRKHILQSSMRIKIISLFLNSAEFKKMILGETDFDGAKSFPSMTPLAGYIPGVQL